MSPERAQDREIRRIRLRALHRYITTKATKDKSFSRLIKDINKDYGHKGFNHPRLMIA